MKCCHRVLSVAGLWLIAAQSVLAAPIYDNGVVVGVDPIAFGVADFDASNQVVDDFSLAPGQTTIRSFHWTGIYRTSDTPTGPEAFWIRVFDQEPSGEARPRFDPIFEQVIGTPIVVPRTDTGVTLSGSRIFAFSVDVGSPVGLTLAANTPYWLSITADTSADTDDNWAWINKGGGNSRQRSADSSFWFSNGQTFDFVLDDAFLTPEPSSGLLALLGLAGWLVLPVRLRRRNS